MLLTDKILAVKNTAVFSSLSQDEILNIADVAKYFCFKLNEPILKKGHTPPFLALITNGSIRSENGSMVKSAATGPLMLGACNILLDIECGQTWFSGSEETQVLLIEKSHFFTILYQCPQIITVLLQNSEASAQSVIQEVV